MKDQENKEEKKEIKEEVKKDDNDEEILLEDEDEIKDEPEYVTREINLDDLYDGAVNNTVVIDPITNNEVLMANKKPNYTIIGVIFAIIVLLVLYYVNNKTDLGNTTKDVEPKKTTTTVNSNLSNVDGTLTCTYQSKSDAESQDVTYTANYENSQIKDSNFKYVVVSNSDNQSAVIEDLKTQYETFFINNATIKGNVVSYEKNSKGFTFSVETNYLKSGFDELVINENQTILFVKPQKTDTIESLQKAYTDKGFNCSLTDNRSEE